MKRFSVGELLTAAPLVRLLRGDRRHELGGVSTDTRTLVEGDLFVALSGPAFDGNEFAREAARRGAGAVLLRATRELLTAPGLLRLERALPERMPILLVDSPKSALAEFGHWHRGRLSARVVGITGSCGKTSTKNILVELLCSRGTVVGSPHSYNNDIGVPHTLFQADEDTAYTVVEMGTNHPGEIARLCAIARPDAAIVTNVGASHLEGLRSIEGVAEEKGALPAAISAGGFCVLEAGARFSGYFASRTRGRVLTFGLAADGARSAGADFLAEDLELGPAGARFTLGGRRIVSPLLGEHNVRNLLAALAACVGLGHEIDDVLPAVSRLHGGARRMERRELAQGITVFDDTYNANPESMRSAIGVVSGLRGHARRVFVLGDMLELGAHAAELHHALGGEAARSGADLFVLVGPLSRATAAGLLEAGAPAADVIHFDDVESARAVLPQMVRSGDLCLFKASRGMRLEVLVNAIEERSRASSSAARPSLAHS